jgi:hypothetical protein
MALRTRVYCSVCRAQPWLLTTCLSDFSPLCLPPYECLEYGSVTISENSMPSCLNLLSSLNASASRAALGRAQVIVAAAYYFFGYWFSYRRA